MKPTKDSLLVLQDKIVYVSHTDIVLLNEMQEKSYDPLNVQVHKRIMSIDLSAKDSKPEEISEEFLNEVQKNWYSTAFYSFINILGERKNITTLFIHPDYFTKVNNVVYNLSNRTNNLFPKQLNGFLNGKAVSKKEREIKIINNTILKSKVEKKRLLRLIQLVSEVSTTKGKNNILSSFTSLINRLNTAEQIIPLQIKDRRNEVFTANLLLEKTHPPSQFIVEFQYQYLRTSEVAPRYIFIFLTTTKTGKLLNIKLQEGGKDQHKLVKDEEENSLSICSLFYRDYNVVIAGKEKIVKKFIPNVSQKQRIVLTKDSSYFSSIGSIYLGQQKLKDKAVEVYDFDEAIVKKTIKDLIPRYKTHEDVLETSGYLLAKFVNVKKLFPTKDKLIKLPAKTKIHYLYLSSSYKIPVYTLNILSKNIQKNTVFNYNSNCYYLKEKVSVPGDTISRMEGKSGWRNVRRLFHPSFQSSKYAVGIEIEKEDRDALQHLTSRKIYTKLYNQYGIALEHDGSINHNIGFEAVFPAMPLNVEYFKDLIEEVPDIRTIITADHSDRCGGHIHVSAKGKNPMQLYNEIFRNYLMLIYAMYYWRLKSIYCAPNDPCKDDTYNRRLAVNLRNSHTIEFRLFPSTRTVYSFLFRLRFIEAMLENPLERPEDVFNVVLSDPTHPVHKLLSEVYYRFNVKTDKGAFVEGFDEKNKTAIITPKPVVHTKRGVKLITSSGENLEVTFNSDRFNHLLVTTNELYNKYYGKNIDIKTIQEQIGNNPGAFEAA